jgi:hypothetical protein
MSDTVVSLCPPPKKACTLASVLGQGHSLRNVAEGYGEVTIKRQAAAVAKMPRYKVLQSTDEGARGLQSPLCHQ